MSGKRLLLSAILLPAVATVACKKKSLAPDTPQVPLPMATAYQSAPVRVGVLTADPNGDDVCFRLDCGDGDTLDWGQTVASGDTFYFTHRWQSAGVHLVRAQARDETDNQSGWSEPCSLDVNPNGLPAVPMIPQGPIVVYRNQAHFFTTSGSDPDGDSVSYRLNWGDGDTSNWGGHVASGTADSASHKWSDQAVFQIQAQARDIHGAESDWSAPHYASLGSRGETLWTRTLGTRETDFCYAVLAESDSGCVVAGVTGAMLGSSWPPYGKFCLARFTAGGAEQWFLEFMLPEVSSGTCRSLVRSADGCYVGTGGVASWLSMTSDACLLKVSPTGETVWTRTYLSDSVAECGNAVANAPSGGFVIAGKSLALNGDTNGLLIKTDAEGNLTWSRTYDAGGYAEEFNSVVATSDGGFLMVGRIRSPSSEDWGDLYIVKTDGGGDTMWSRRLGSEYPDYGQSVQETWDRGFIIGGTTEGCLWLLRIDAYGALLWQQNLTEGWCQGGVATLTSDRGYALVGVEYGSQSPHHTDLCLVSADGLGNALWSEYYGGSSDEYVYAIQENVDGGFIIGGTTESFGLGSSDMYVIRTKP